MKKLGFVLGLAVLAGAANADLLWDYGWTTGTEDGAWVNQTSGQNFADNVSFANDVTVTRFVYYTSFDPSAFGTMHIKLWSDNGTGDPGAEITSQDVAVASWSNVSGDINEVNLDLTTPWTLTGGTTYWIGASGNGFEAAQLTVHTPGDGTTAQFNAGSFSFHANIGDQMFRLEGFDAVPEPASLAVLGAGLLVFARRRRTR